MDTVARAPDSGQRPPPTSSDSPRASCPPESVERVVARLGELVALSAAHCELAVAILDATRFGVGWIDDWEREIGDWSGLAHATDDEIRSCSVWLRHWCALQLEAGLTSGRAARDGMKDP